MRKAGNMGNERKLVLVTGVSSGIGSEACKLFKRKGYRVIALSRNSNDRCDTHRYLTLDLGSFELIEALSDMLETEIAAADRVVLVNNAGYGQFGALRDLSEEMWSKQFSAHVFGPIKLASVCLRLCEKHAVPMRVIAVSSVLSIVPQRMKGLYSTSKHAMNAAHDSFWFDERENKHLESVSIVLPGPVATQFRANALSALEPLLSAAHANRRADYDSMAAALAPGARRKPLTASAWNVASRIFRAAESSRPKPRYYVTPQTYIAVLITRLLPHSLQRLVLR